MEAKSWMRTAISTIGGVAAGPAGAVIGSLVGGLLTAVLPGGASIVTDIVKGLATRGIINVSDKVVKRLSPHEKAQINHDLQTAFRDAFREALYDLGDVECFPKIKDQSIRDVPPGVSFPQSTQGSPLWHGKSPLALQVKDVLQALEAALDAQQIIPLEPPVEKIAANVQPYLDAETPVGLEEAFFEQNITPTLLKFKSLLVELPALEIHLRRNMYARTIVHLAEILKHRTPAWRAYNRIILETVQSEIAQVAKGQEEFVKRLDNLITNPDPAVMVNWSDSMADLMSEFGKVEARIDEGFDELSQRLVSQHLEILTRMDNLSQTAARIETKVDRVLTILQDGKYVIGGTPTVPIHRPPAPGETPFMGLQPFTENDADRFFGRERLVARLVGRLNQSCFLAVIGASGSGKSSVVRAGLIPVLRGTKVIPEVPALPVGSPTWQIRTFTPTDHPLMSLAACLSASSDSSKPLPDQVSTMQQDPKTLDITVRELAAANHTGQVLLIVDQFEELFTLCQDVDEQTAFIDNLLAAASPKSKGVLFLIIILRADYYANCSDFDNLRSAIAEQQEYIGAMTQDELRQAIEQPALKSGWKFEPGLVDLILQDAGNEPGVLPLLSHALLETWRRRSSHTMTLESYAESGGVKGAIAKTADMIYSHSLTVEQQKLARSIFLRLVNLAEDGRVSRRRASLDELTFGDTSSAEAVQVLKLLADMRLITTEEGSAQLAHEALIASWPLLRNWIEEDRAGLRIHRRLSDAAREWNRSGRDEGLLYRGVRLDETREWAEQKKADLNEMEQEFLKTSLALRDHETAEKESNRQRELESAQRLAKSEKKRAEEQTRAAKQLRNRAYYLTGALGFAGLLALLAVILAVVAMSASSRASKNAQVAEQNLVTAEAASTLAVAQQATAEAERSRAETEKQRADQQRLLAQTGQLDAQSQTAMLENFPQRSILLAIEAYRRSSGLAGPQAVQARNMLWQTVTNSGGEVIASHPAPIGTLAVSHDGKWLATAGTDFTIRLWDLTITKPTPIILVGHKALISTLIFTPGDDRLISTSYDKTIMIWNLAGSDPGYSSIVIQAHDSEITGAVLSPDGRQLATCSTDNTVRLWNLSSSNPAAQPISFTGHTKPIYAIAISPDGRWLASASGDNTTRLWDLTASDPPQAVKILSAHTSIVFSVAFSPDSHWLVTGSQDRTARLWDLYLPDPTQNSIALSGHDSFIITTSFSKDSRWLFTGSGDSTIRRWDISSTDPASTSLALRGHTNWISFLTVSPDGKRLVSTSLDHTARVWDVSADDPNISVVVLNGHDSAISTASFTPDSQYVFTASDDTTARRWKLGQIEQSPAPLVIRSHDKLVGALGFTLNGRFLISTSEDGTSHLFDMQEKRVTGILRGHIEGIYTMATSPDSHWLVTTGFDNQALLFDLTAIDPSRSTVVLSTFRDIATDITFTPDSKSVIVGSKDGEARLFRLDKDNPASDPIIFKGHNQGVSSVTVHPSGKWLATAAWEGKVRLWNLTAPDPSASPLILADCSGPVIFSLDGKWLASDCYDQFNKNVVNVWETSNFSASPRVFTNRQGYFINLSFSPDSRWLAGGGEDFNVYLWDMNAADPDKDVSVLVGHTGAVYALTFSPDKHWLASSSADGVVRLWDLAASDPASQSLALHGHVGKVYGIAFSPDSAWLASGGDDTTVRLWTMNMDSLVETACDLAGRNLIPSEWQQFFFGEEYRKICP
jgi:WD40 repeat protein